MLGAGLLKQQSDAVYYKVLEQPEEPEIEYVRISFFTNGGEQANFTEDVEIGKTLTEVPPAPTREGYNFQGWWTEIEGGSQLDIDQTFQEPIIYYAHWEPKTYSVIFNANGGGENTTMTGTYGSTLGTLPTLERDGYDFGGWWTAASGGNQVSASTTITGNITYYVHWIENKPEPEPQPEPDPSIANVHLIIASTRQVGEKIGELPTASLTGHVFDGWWTHEVDGETIDESTIVQDANVYYAHWLDEDEKPEPEPEPEPEP